MKGRSFRMTLLRRLDWIYWLKSINRSRLTALSISCYAGRVFDKAIRASPILSARADRVSGQQRCDVLDVFLGDLVDLELGQQQVRCLGGRTRAIQASLELDCVRHPQRVQEHVDLGCGLGATLRSFARRLPHARLLGITRVPWQVARANALNDAAGFGERVRVIEGDYEDTLLPIGSYDGACALESAALKPYLGPLDPRASPVSSPRMASSGRSEWIPSLIRASANILV